jgi:hypothetical protein
MMSDKLRSLLVAHGALVFLAGMAAGFPFAIAILDTGDVRAWRMAHLEGILNGLTLIGVAAVGSQLSLSSRAQQMVAWSLVVTAWGNMIASFMGPIFGARGLTFGGTVANSLMYLLFMVAVVAVVLAMWLVFRGALRRGG